MAQWPRRPTIYEVNTWTWLHELSERHGRTVMLHSVPDSEWDALGALGVDAVWLMGVWERSPEGVRVAREDAALMAELRGALPDVGPEDLIGSAYCIRSYTVDGRLGGDAGLAAAREALSKRGLKLILDYVPNHVARDHAWVDEHPEFFIRGDEEDLRRAPGAFFEANGKVIACGRDPYFPPWQDVAQVNAFDDALRAASIETLSSIAERCDGMRCDMAMLLMNDIFTRTWGERAGPRPSTDYWPTVIGAVRQRHPDVLFIAEAYWELEGQLQEQGFDFCYDKRLYDRLRYDNAEAVRTHLSPANLSYQDKVIHFIENHDEPRAAVSFMPPQRAKAAVVAIMTLPGATLLHEGQLEGLRIRTPVQLRRRAREPRDHALREFYRRLLQTARDRDRFGDWTLCDTCGWPDNASHQNLLAWCWSKDDRRLLVVINDAIIPSRGRVRLPWQNLQESNVWRLHDPVNEQIYLRSGREMADEGLFVDLGPWCFHYLNFSRESVVDR